MSDEREKLKPPHEPDFEAHKLKPPHEPDFQAHKLKPPHATDEPEDAEQGILRREGDDAGDDFEAHKLKKD